MRPLADLVPPAALAPLGYRPAPDRPAIVPVYPPGLPIVMAALERLGGKRAVFLTVPLLGGLTLWATFMMGTRLAGPNVGLAAALLLGTNPLFFSRAMYAESDVPATAWWAWTFALLLFPGRLTSLAAGCAAGLAILTRPNLIPLAIVPVGVLIWEALRDRSALPRHRAVLFAVGTVPAGLLLAWTNDYWYGSVLTSGHGAVSDHFQWTNIQPNLSRYPVWLLQSLTPAVGLAPAAPFVAGRLRPKVTLQTTRRWMVAWLTFAAGVVFAYLFYKPWNDVGYLRFLLPAYPVLLVLVMVAVVGMVTLLPAKAHAVVPAVLVCALAARNVVEWSRVRLFDHGTALLYRTMGEHLARRLPEPSVILSMQHSGSAQYYSGHPTVRWDYIPEEHLDKIVERLRQLGYHPYLLLEGWEEALFRRRFAGRNVLGALDWRPSAVIPPALVTLYDTNARQSGDSTPFETDVILQRP
jgi:hypothetical protein